MPISTSRRPRNRRRTDEPQSITPRVIRLPSTKQVPRRRENPQLEPMRRESGVPHSVRAEPSAVFPGYAVTPPPPKNLVSPSYLFLLALLFPFPFSFFLDCAAGSAPPRAGGPPTGSIARRSALIHPLSARSHLLPRRKGRAPAAAVAPVEPVEKPPFVWVLLARYALANRCRDGQWSRPGASLGSHSNFFGSYETQNVPLPSSRQVVRKRELRAGRSPPGVVVHRRAKGGQRQPLAHCGKRD